MVRGLGLGLPGYDADECLLCPGRTVDGVNKELSKTVTIINHARLTVFIFAGTNDSHHPHYNLAGFIFNFTALITTVKTKYPNSRLVFLSLLPRTVCSCTKTKCKACDTFRVQSLETLLNKVNDINRHIKSVCCNDGYNYLDLHFVYLNQQEYLLKPDGLHPNEIGKDIINEQIRKLLKWVQ